MARIAKVVPDNQARSGDVLILGSDTYIDFNPAELIRYHREQGKSVTRAFDELGPLVLWVVDAERFPWSDDPDFLATGEVDTAYYRVEGYVNRLQSLRDLRTRRRMLSLAEVNCGQSDSKCGLAYGWRRMSRLRKARESWRLRSWAAESVFLISA